MNLDVIYSKSCQKMSELPDESIDCTLTSPPYFGLRDYGEDVKEIWGGDSDCKHEFEGYTRPAGGGHPNPDKAQVRASKKGIQRIFAAKVAFCQKCDAWYGQLGLEPTFQLYLDHLMIVCAEIKRVLKQTGSLWLNLGDTYGGSGGAGGDYNKGGLREGQPKYKQGKIGYQKSLLGIPWRLVLRLIDEGGWILRNAVVWHKPNSMPASVKDRCSNSYEFLFHLVKAKKYYYDLDAIREPHTTEPNLNIEKRRGLKSGNSNVGQQQYHSANINYSVRGKNPGDVFGIPIDYKPGLLNREEAAYIAGLIDGEGCIVLQEKRTNDILFLAIVNTHRGVLEWLKSRVGAGRLYHRKRDSKWRETWEYNLYSSSAASLILAVYPWLIIKKEQAKTALEFQSLGVNVGQQIDDWAKSRRKKLIEINHQLNQHIIEKSPSPDPFQQEYNFNEDVWTISTQPRPESHFSTFPDKLCIKPILATCPAEICKKCGKARVRITKSKFTAHTGTTQSEYQKGTSANRLALLRQAAREAGGEYVNERETIGWTDCGCGEKFEPGVLLDPFAGRGTALIEAKKMGRHYVGYELKKEYAKMCIGNLEEIDPLFQARGH